MESKGFFSSSTGKKLRIISQPLFFLFLFSFSEFFTERHFFFILKIIYSVERRKIDSGFLMGSDKDEILDSSLSFSKETNCV